MNYILHKSNGEIHRVGTVPTQKDMLAQVQAGETAIEGSGDSLKDWVVNGVITTRPVNTTTIDKTSVSAFDKEIVTLTGVSSTSTLSVNGKDYPCDGTDIALKFYEPMSYHIRVTDFPKTDFEVLVNAT